MYSTKSYAAPSASSPLAPFTFDRRDPTPNDVQIDILFCGVCHSDLHTVEAYERMLKSDVKYRFVIDLATLS
jgi:D-arabinose 1-dehydrogenase-like Zn-dependent alcohol dehydrogenase